MTWTPSNTLRTALLVGALGLALLRPAPASTAEIPASTAGCAYASAVPSTVSVAAVRSSKLCLLNVERRRCGMRPLRPDRRLRRAAMRHARDMDARNYFDHTSRGGASFVDRIRRARYLKGARSWTVGENIAWGSGRLATPRSIMRAWMNSPGHRANILNRRFREIGVGVSQGAPTGGVGNGATYATSFGARRG
jgi:uncharacterized protein YkwD